MGKGVIGNAGEGRCGGAKVGGVPQSFGLGGEKSVVGVVGTNCKRRDAVEGVDFAPMRAAVGGAVEAAEPVGRAAPTTEYAYEPGILRRVVGIDDDVLRPVEHSWIGAVGPRLSDRIKEEDAGAGSEGRCAVAGVGAEDFAVIEHDDGCGMTLGAGRIGEFCPSRRSTVLKVARNEDSAGGGVDHAGIHPIVVGWVESEPEDGMAEVVDGLPSHSVIRGENDFAVGIDVVERAVGKARALIEIVDVGCCRIERASGRMLNDAIHGVGGVAILTE